MADNEIGIFLNITPDVLKKLDSFDKKLEKIQVRAGVVAAAFKKGLGSVVVDTSKLESAIISLTNKISALGTAGNAVQNIGTAMDSTAQRAQKTATATTSITQSLSGMAQMANQLSTSQPFKNWNVEKLRTTQSALLKEMEALREKYMRISSTNKPLIATISGESKNEIGKLYAQIQQLAKAMGSISAKQLPNAATLIKPYVDEIQRLKEEIQRVSSASNTLSAPLRKELAAVKKEYETLSNYIQTVNSKIVESIGRNDAMSQQSKKINDLKTKIQEVVSEFEKLKSSGNAYNSDGSLSAQSRQLAAKKKSLEEELRLQGQSLQQAIDSENKKAALAEKAAQRAVKAAEQTAKAAEAARAREEKASERAAAKAEKDAERKAKADERAAQRADKAAEALARQQEIARRTTPQGALDYSKNAKSLRDQANAINYLKQARLSLNTTDANYKNTLTSINNAIAQHNRALQQAGVQSQSLARNHRNLMDTAGQLKRQLALVFSVSQIEGYISKIVQVRGQFELQQVALRAIVQDKDKADRIFSQTMQQALKSPFQAMRLVTFTKQLAAYRIESDKLFDTTKRLADVSAGLGVDMQRLILAYGQVKAAAYLRGTEVRQFTEAGINLYGELQSYFEEVKGEAYTTAQIVDMISKRMVKFEDVEAVFQRMTDKGGLFYNMQEIQVNTLHGQINRLKDVISLMMNEIGKSNQGGISQAISLINTLLENWRLIAIVLEQVVAGYAAYKAVSFAVWLKEINWMKAWNTLAAIRYAFMKKQTLQTKIEIMNQRGLAAAAAGNVAAFNAMAAAQERMNIAMKMNPWGMALSAVLALGIAIYEVVQYTSRLDKELNNIKSEGLASVYESTANYKQLADIVSDSTKSYGEHNKALAELKRKYADVLPEQYLNEEGIKSLKGNYESATKAITEYINAKTKERVFEKLGEEYGKDVFEHQEDLAKTISEQIKSQKGITVEWAKINGIITEIKQKVDDGTISMSSFISELENAIKSSLGLSDLDFSKFGTQTFAYGTAGVQVTSQVFTKYGKALNDFIDTIMVLSEKQKEELSFFDGTAIPAFVEGWEKKKKAAEESISKVAKSYEVLRDSQKENSKVTKDELEVARTEVQKFLKSIGSDVKVDSAYINKLFSDSFFFQDEVMNAQKGKLSQLYKILLGSLAEASKNGGKEAGAVWLQEFEKQINGLNLNPLQNSIKKFLLGISGNADIQANWNIRSGETEAEFKKRIKTEIDTRNEIIRKSQSTIYPEYGQDTSKVKSELEELVRLYDELGGDKKKGGSKAERDIWAERISVLKEMQARYEKLNDLMGENRAIAETRTAFEGALRFTSMGEVIKAEDIIPTKQGMIDALEKLLAAIPNGVKNAAKKTGLEKEIAELKIGIQQDYLKEQLDKTKKNIEDMFNGLDLHQKLKDAGLSEAEVQQLFPGLAKTLDDVSKGMESEYQKRFPKGEYLIADTDANKQYKADQEKLNQQRIKEQQTLVIELTKAYKTQLSDQLQLDRWYYEEKAKIAKANLTDEQKIQYEANLSKLYGQKTDENTWKQFQKSNMYISLFENLESSSTRMLTALRDKLADLRENLKNLPADQLKAIINQQEKIDGLIAGRNPFSGLVSGAKEYIEFLKQRKELEEENIRANNAVAYYTEQRDAQSKIVQQKQQEYNKAVETYGVNSKQAMQLSVQLSVEKTKLDVILKQLVAEGKITEETAEQIRNGQKLGKTLSDKFNEVGSNLSEFSSTLPQIASDLENVFGTMSDGTKDTIDSISEIAGGLGQTASGIGRIMSGDIIGGGLQAIGGLAKTIGSIFAIGDKKKEREIQRQIDSVERLQKAYDVLKEKMDNAWSAVSFSDMNKQTLQNVDAQIASYEAMIRAEEDKKKTDHDRIEEWQDAIKELEKTRKELQQQAIEEMGGIGETNYKDAASQFASAWVDAFNESEDALLALQETFDDYITNLIKKQAMMRLVQARMKSVFEAIDKSVTEGSAGGINLTKEELANIQKMGESALAGLNEDLLALMETLGYKPSGGGKAELSALTQSIQGITEREAEVLESLLNSIRFFVSQQTTDVTAIRNILESEYLSSGDGSSNPMLIELKSQTEYLKLMSDNFESILSYNGNKGRGIRVFMQ